MPNTYEEANSLEGDAKISMLTGIRSLADRAIVQASKQVHEDNKHRKERAERWHEEYVERPNPPHMIASRDMESWDAHMNTGMVWVTNSSKGNELLDLWWSKILDDRFPTKEYYCHLVHKKYKKLKDCLAACGIEEPGYYHQCGITPDHEQWINRHGGKRFDQDVLRDLHRDREHPPIMDALELITQRGNFGLVKKKVQDKETEDFVEGLNVFFRSHVPNGQRANIVGYNPMVDKWVHVSGLASQEKNDFIALWLTRVMNYPVRDKVHYSANDLYPLDVIPFEPGWKCPPAKHDHPPVEHPVHEPIPAPPIPSRYDAIWMVQMGLAISLSTVGGVKHKSIAYFMIRTLEIMRTVVW